MSAPVKNARRRAREFALQALYQWQVAGQSLTAIEAQYAEMEGYGKSDEALFHAILRGAMKKQEALALLMTPHLDRAWKEVDPVERAIMLLSGWELTEMPETPVRVILNEAIELAKIFGGTDGHKYINGVLDKLAIEVRPDEVGSEAIAPPRERVEKPVKVSVKVRRGAKPA